MIRKHRLSTSWLLFFMSLLFCALIYLFDLFQPVLFFVISILLLHPVHPPPPVAPLFASPHFAAVPLTPFLVSLPCLFLWIDACHWGFYNANYAQISCAHAVPRQQDTRGRKTVRNGGWEQHSVMKQNGEIEPIWMPLLINPHFLLSNLEIW